MFHLPTKTIQSIISNQCIINTPMSFLSSPAGLLQVLHSALEKCLRHLARGGPPSGSNRSKQCQKYFSRDSVVASRPSNRH